MAGKRGKIIIFSAPSGSGKSSIINGIRANGRVAFAFSVSATNRPPRPGEKHGKEYYFLSDDEFREKMDAGEFVETCEVYPGRFYGTLKSEITAKCDNGENIFLDVDVEGGLRIKELFGDDALALFIMPPSIAELQKRLEQRATDTPEKIAERVARAQYEISMSPRYDAVVTNEVLENAVAETETIISNFLGDR